MDRLLERLAVSKTREPLRSVLNAPFWAPAGCSSKSVRRRVGYVPDENRGGPRESGAETRMNGSLPSSEGNIHSIRSCRDGITDTIEGNHFTAINRQMLHEPSSCRGGIGRGASATDPAGVLQQ